MVTWGSLVTTAVRGYGKSGFGSWVTSLYLGDSGRRSHPCFFRTHWALRTCKQVLHIHLLVPGQRGGSGIPGKNKLCLIRLQLLVPSRVLPCPQLSLLGLPVAPSSNMLPLLRATLSMVPPLLHWQVIRFISLEALKAKLDRPVREVIYGLDELVSIWPQVWPFAFNYAPHSLSLEEGPDGR